MNLKNHYERNISGKTSFISSINANIKLRRSHRISKFLKTHLFEALSVDPSLENIFLV